MYVNSPFGICLAHNGNLINESELNEDLFRTDRRHINTSSDSEVLLNVFAHELQSVAGMRPDHREIFQAIERVHERANGAYAVVAMIIGYGIVGFRDPNGIRPVCYGKRERQGGTEYMIASESVALSVLGFEMIRDIDPGEALRGVEEHFGSIEPGERPPGVHTREPEQEGERRVVVERPGTTRYLDVAFHAPAFADEDFVPLLVADAVLSGGKGVNLWAGGFGRNARTTSPLYQALVESELVAGVSSALLPTEQPYLYGISATVRDGVAEAAVEEALFAAVDALSSAKPADHALRKAKNQLLAQLAFDDEGVTRIAHQLGYFSTIAEWGLVSEIEGQIEAVTAEQVRDVVGRRLAPNQRTVGWFRPQAQA